MRSFRYIPVTCTLLACAHQAPQASLSFNEDTYIAIPDVHGTTRAQIVRGEVVEVYVDPWGGGATYSTPRAFESHDVAIVGGGISFGSRHMLPGHGVWTTPDPTFQTTPWEFNGYVFASHNPASIRDLAGTCASCEPSTLGSRFVEAVIAVSRIGTLQRIADDAVTSYYEVKDPRVRVYMDPETHEVLGWSKKDAWSVTWEHSSGFAKEAHMNVTLQKGIESLPFQGAPPGGIRTNIEDSKLRKYAEKAAKSHKKDLQDLQKKLNSGLLPHLRGLSGNLYEIGAMKSGGPRVFFTVKRNEKGLYYLQILGWSNKDNQHKVLTRLIEMGYTGIGTGRQTKQ